MTTANESLRNGVALTGPGGSIRIGQRYRTPVWADAWMRGERYATVTKVGRKLVHFTGDHGLKLRFTLATAADMEQV